MRVPGTRCSAGRRLLVAAALLIAGSPEFSGKAAAAPPELAAAASPAPAVTDHRVLGWTLVGGSYAVMGAYSYYSWYNNAKPSDFYFHDEGWFGADTYAGGADKLGHVYANYVITRTGYDVLAWAGVPRDRALAASLALDAAFFTAIEIKDGFTDGLGFSWGDIASNLAGNLLAVAFERLPALDAAIDLRLQYYPSQEYLDAVGSKGTINAVEDYTGMTFGLWYHLGAIPGLQRHPGLTWLRFLDVGVTYGSRYYRPLPAEPRTPERELGAALGLNLAEVSRSLARGRHPDLVRATDWAFEYFTLPGTTLGTH